MNSNILYIITVLNESLFDGNQQDRARSLNQHAERVILLSCCFVVEKCLWLICCDIALE